MKKIVIIQNKVLHYRIPFYIFLAKKYNLTVMHSGKKCENGNFSEIILKKKRIKNFHWQIELNKSINKIQPDVIIAIADIQWLSTFSLLLINKKAKFIWWGFDTGRSKFATAIKKYLIEKADACIFYNEFAKDSFQIKNNKTKLYIANNTFDVGLRVKCFEYEEKDSFLFVGSFDKRKRIDLLIIAFSKLIDSSKELKLRLIGTGEDFDNIKQLINKLGVSKKVELLGRIESPALLKSYYQKAWASVSFGQAGLSILQSLGFGVPFISKINAISGGELSNVIDGYNGCLCDDSVSSLQAVMQRLLVNSDECLNLGRNAYNYYSQECTIENMVESFADAIEGK